MTKLPNLLCRRITWAIALFLTPIVALLAFITQPLVSPVPSQSPRADSARLKADVKFLSVDLYPRSFERFRNIELAAQYISDGFKAAGAAVSVQEVVVQEAKYKNIIARFGPQTGPVLVIGAHYDSHGDAGLGARDPRGYTPESHTPGADDNASGVAGLLELSRMLGREKPSRNRSEWRRTPRNM